MNSEKKFDYALKACEGVVHNLRTNDLFSLVSFDDQMEVVVPMSTLDRKERILSLIRKLNTGGMTNLSGGWKVASDEFKKAEPGMLKRMLLLTDGIANRGILDHRQLITLVEMECETKHSNLLSWIRRILPRGFAFGYGDSRNG